VVLVVLSVATTLWSVESQAQNSIGTPLVIKQSYEEFLRYDTIKAIALIFDSPTSDSSSTKSIRCWVVKSIHRQHSVSGWIYPEINITLLSRDKQKSIDNFFAFKEFNW
ncbi:MAG: hypothetical protein ACTHMM_12010, partial [Agriterribacter sp.]